MFTKLVIDRSKWLCMEEFRPSGLLNSENKRMCCLGFAALALGIKPAAIADSGHPQYLPGQERWQETPFMDPYDLTSSDFSSRAMSINDNWHISVKEKETKLKALFKTIGVTLTFTGTIAGKKSKPVAKRKVKRHKAS